MLNIYVLVETIIFSCNQCLVLHGDFKITISCQNKTYFLATKPTIPNYVPRLYQVNNVTA